MVSEEVASPARGGLASWVERARAVGDELARHPFATALLLASALYLLVLGVLTPGFDTNDDLAMMGFVTGTTYGAPSEHVVFMNVGVGLALKHAYLWTNEVAWYGLMLYGLQFVAIVGILWALVRTGPRRIPWFWLALTGLVVVFLAPMTLRVQFTSVAILMGAAGILVHVVSLTRARSPWWIHVAAGALLGAASLIRLNSFYATLVLALPILVWQVRLRGDVLARYAIFGGVAAAIVVSGMAFDSAYYERRPDWQAYHEYNAARGTLHQTPRLDETPEIHAVLPEIGWTANDLTMFRSWFFPDQEHFSTPALQRIVEATNRDGRDLPQIRTSARHLLERRTAATTTALAIGALAWTVVAWRRRAWLLGIAGLSFGTFAYLISFSRFPSRVALPLLLLAAAGALVIGSPPRSAEPPRSPALRERWAPTRVATALAAIVIAVAALASIPGLLHTSRAFAARDAQRHQVTASLARFAEERDAVLVSWGGSLDTGFKPPLAAPDDALYDIDVISLGWPTHSPDWSAQLERVGIDDLGEALLHDPRLYIAAWPTLFEPLAWYMYEHHGELPDFSLAFARAPGTTGHHSDLFRLYLRTDLPDDLPPRPTSHR